LIVGCRLATGYPNGMHPLWLILTCNVGQADIIFGVLSRFIGGSEHARLQVSVCSGYDLCHPG